MVQKLRKTATLAAAVAGVAATLALAAPADAAPGAAPGAGQAARTAKESGTAARPFTVQVGDWAVPHLNVRDDPYRPGKVIGNVAPGTTLDAECGIPNGASITMWGRTTTRWAKIAYNGGTAWVWGGGLKSALLPVCR